MEAPLPDKLTGELSDRISGCGPDDRLRVVLKLRLPAGSQADRSAKSRADTMAQNKQALESATQTIDQLLAACGGQRLSEPNALGTLVVEVAARDIAALALADEIELVMEDSSVFPLGR